MSRVRTIFIGSVLALMTLGYLASQWAALNGTAPAHAASVDQPPIHLLSLIVMIAAIALAFFRDREGQT
jgi:hypothetical protein